ncbi:MAG: hypothetical protein HKN76_22585 [Saprospiraceae bacterium]|nr:hypothetical protein [Saprospiraceae bacterium]
MDAAHLHLILNHFPILGTLFGIGLLAHGILAKNTSTQNAGLMLFLIIALISIPAFLTGEGAEETVEHLPGVSENLINIHEEWAEKAVWLMGFLGLLSASNLFFFIKKRPVAKALTLTTLVVALVTFGMMAQVGNLGGQIRHTEIQKFTDQTTLSGKFEMKREVEH